MHRFFKLINFIILKLIILIEFLEKKPRTNDKIIDSQKLNNIFIDTPEGFDLLESVHKTQKFEIYKICVEVNNQKIFLESADNHIVYLCNETQVFVKDLHVNDKIITKFGLGIVKSIVNTHEKVYMYDVSIQSQKHTYYANNILSHNTSTTAFFIAWYICFNYEKNILIVANKAETMQEIIDKISIVYEFLPFYLKPGITVLNKRRLEFDNGCRIIGQATTTKPGIGFNIHLLYCDEFAHIPKHIIEPFYHTVYPTLSASKIAKVIITSTPNRMNLFFRIYTDALKGKNNYNPIKVDWWEVPGRDEEWKQREINNLGSEAAFNQEYGNQFLNDSNLIVSKEVASSLEANKKEFEWKQIDVLDKHEINYTKLTWDPEFDPDKFDFDSNFIFLSIDTAEGTGLNHTVMNIFKLEAFEENKIDEVTNIKDEFSFLRLQQIGLFRDNGMSISDFANFLEVFVFRFLNYNKTQIILEVNYKGELIINKLSQNRNFDEVLFYHSRHSTTTEFQSIGLKITPANKPILISKLNYYLKSGVLNIYEKQTILEIMAFGINEKNKYTSQIGSDDAFMTCINVCDIFESTSYYDICSEFFDTLNNNLRNLIHRRISKHEMDLDKLDDNNSNFDVYSLIKNLE